MLDYPNVSKWINNEGLLGHLIKAHTTTITRTDCIRYTEAIVGRLPIRFKSSGSSFAYYPSATKPNGAITYRTFSDRVRLSSILHECAHILNYRKGGYLRGTPHGEPFRRAYARLLREVCGSQSFFSQRSP